MATAKREDWQTKPFTDTTTELFYQRDFSPREMQKIQLGFIPKVMEDKWFIYFEDNTLNFHRSWTGNKIYQVNFTKSEGPGQSN